MNSLKLCLCISLMLLFGCDTELRPTELSLCLQLDNTDTKISSSRSPLLLLDSKGVIYVIWTESFNVKDPRSSSSQVGLSSIPEKYLGAIRDNHGDQNRLLISVSKDRNKFTAPMLMTNSPTPYSHVAGWVKGQLLNLLLSDEHSDSVRHLQFDLGQQCWSLVGEVPVLATHYSSFVKSRNGFHIAAINRGKLTYSFFRDGEWASPRTWDIADRRSPGVVRVKMAVDVDGIVYFVVWDSNKQRDAHTFITLNDTRSLSTSLTFTNDSINESHYDIGLDPSGHVMIAYRPNLDEEDPNKSKLHVRYLRENGWSSPKRLSGEWVDLYGFVNIVTGKAQTAIVFLGRTEFTMGKGILSTSVNYYCSSTGSDWSYPTLIAGIKSRTGSVLPVGATHPSLQVDAYGNMHYVCIRNHVYYCTIPVQKK